LKHIHFEKLNFIVKNLGKFFINWFKLLTKTAGSYPKFDDDRSIRIFNFSVEVFGWDLNYLVHGEIS